MPTYSFDIKELLFEEDVRKMLDACRNTYERAAISLLWVAGPRPIEAITLTPEKFQISQSRMAVVIATAKLDGNTNEYQAKERLLEFDRPTGAESNIYVETIIQAVAMTPSGKPILPYSTRWLEKLTNRLGEEILGKGKRISPYHFRHSVMTWGARNGWTLDKLKHFKGAASYNSVWPYLNAQPFVVKLQLMRRGLD